ncbi:hypothetical protein ACWCP6_14820 [Streptomyces sp. NPDC002004]
MTNAFLRGRSGAAPSGAAGPATEPPAPGPRGRLARYVAHRNPVLDTAVLLVTALLLLMAVRLPWAGDLGIHAAVLDRLRTDLTAPGDPLVDAAVPSPYYSPWTVTLALAAKATGAGTFTVLRAAALADVLLLLTGVRHFVRTLTRRRAAPPLAVLCLLFLLGVQLFTWSGLTGLTSLSLCLAYPSTFALGLSFHLWALLRKALADDRGPVHHLALGVLLAVVLLSHQFTGVVACTGLLAVLLGARPWPSRSAWAKVAAAAALALALLAAWPYYSVFSLLRAGGLDAIHRPLYDGLLPRFCLVLTGVAALAARARRDRRDPLVLFFALGVTVYAAGGLTGHWSWGRVLPAALVPAQLAAAIEAAGARLRGGAGAGPGRFVRGAFAAVTGAALLIGCWAQAGASAYVLPSGSLPWPLSTAPVQPAWPGFDWAMHSVRPGQTVLTEDFRALRMLPGYGAYTVAPAYPDAFLPDQARRTADTARYFAPGTPRAERLAVLRRYHVAWIVQWRSDGGLPPGDPAVRVAGRGADGSLLLRVRTAGAPSP